MNYSLTYSKPTVKSNVYRSIDRLKNLNEEPKNCFAKIMVNYYQCILEGDLLKGQKILDFLRENGMDEIVAKIKI